MSYRRGVRPSAALLALLAGILALSGCGGDEAAAPTMTPATTPQGAAGAGFAVTVTEAWVRATPGDSAGQMTGAFLTLHNAGPQAERLVQARAEGAGAVELHETTMRDDVMQMAPVEGVDLPAGESVTLAPGGLHLMLLDLASPLAPGGTVALTLVFASGLELEVEAEVRPLVAE
ncbi:MAG: copper chaperone PCu(A)C [Chloroflexota bacterium]